MSCGTADEIICSAVTPSDPDMHNVDEQNTIVCVWVCVCVSGFPLPLCEDIY